MSVPDHAVQWDVVSGDGIPTTFDFGVGSILYLDVTNDVIDLVEESTGIIAVYNITKMEITLRPVP